MDRWMRTSGIALWKLNFNARVAESGTLLLWTSREGVARLMWKIARYAANPMCSAYSMTRLRRSLLLPLHWSDSARALHEECRMLQLKNTSITRVTKPHKGNRSAGQFLCVTWWPWWLTVLQSDPRVKLRLTPDSCYSYSRSRERNRRWQRLTRVVDGWWRTTW